MYKRNAQGWLKHLDFFIIDEIVLQVAFIIASLIRHHYWPYFVNIYRNLGLIYGLTDALVIMLLSSMHNVLSRGLLKEAVDTIKHCLVVFLCTTAYMFAFQQGDTYSRVVLFLTLGFHILLGYVTRVGWKWFIVRYGVPIRKKGTMLVVLETWSADRIMERLLSDQVKEYQIVGAVLNKESGTGGNQDEGEGASGEMSRKMDGKMSRDMTKDVSGEASIDVSGNLSGSMSGETSEGNYRDISLDSFQEKIRGTSREEICGIPVVASLEEVSDYICREWIDSVYIDCPSTDPAIAKLMDDCRQMAIPVHYHVPGMSRSGEKQFVEKIGGTTVLTTTINYLTPTQNFLKRCMDIVGGLVGSVMAVVVMLIIGPMIKKASPGPILYTQERIGRNGKRFQIKKIRSMYMDADERKQELMEQNRVKDGMMFKLDFDPRIIGNEILPDGTQKTGIGEFIRKTSLDEFPQFFNVLMGQMSLVGTRPPTPDEWERYEFHHRARLACKPGITGMWQVSGRSEITDFEEVVKLDTEYITNWSFGMDVKMIAKTVGVVLGGRGAM